MIKRLRSDDEPTRMQMWIIGYIRNREASGNMFQGELEREFNITRATASSILKRMERDGLITRQQTFSDARRKRIELTDEALRISDSVARKIEENERLMAEGIDKDDLAVFYKVLDQVKRNLSKEE